MYFIPGMYSMVYGMFFFFKTKNDKINIIKLNKKKQKKNTVNCKSVIL